MNGRRSTRFFTGLAFALLLAPYPADAQDSAAVEAVAQCLTCHDYGEDSPVHPLLHGSHGIEGDPEDMAGRRGCLDCHGDSKAHIRDPRRESPDVSFGPRWSASAGEQDQRCLSCHEGDVAVNWRHALHMVNNLTCVTCHDLMANEDRVLFEEQQAAVCTTCHKAQRSGIHDLGEGAPDNPPCSLCHNPHDHESAATRMRENQSLGCVVCHDQAQMESLAILNTQAGKYHRVMAEQARSCIDCHEGIAHAPEDSAPPMHPHPVRERTVVLFHPGHINHQWLLREHPGSQPLRQGAHCRRCHRGDEAGMGASLAAGFTPSHREVSMAFAREVDQLVINLSWEGPAADRHLALMWGDASYPTFRQAGCFAACHGGEQGNARELFGKYPYAAEKSSDQSTGTMDIPAAAGQRAELWRIPLGSAAPDTALLSGDAGPRPGNRLSVERHYSHGQWSVTLRLQLDTADSGIHFSGQGPYTFAVALHGAENPGRAHWVSLPLTLSFGGNDTDFTAQ